MEKIDLYNINKEKLGKTFIRNQDTLLENEYYLLPQVWIINSNNEILLTRRNLNKSYGGMWEPTSGHVKSGETSLEAIQRELFEEIGLTIEQAEFHLVTSFIHKQSIRDIWVVRKDIKVNELTLSENEVIDAKFVTEDEFKQMLENKEAIESLSYFIDIYQKLQEEQI